MERSYLITMTALIIHQIDAAYWKEWDMFFISGGIQGFLVFNIIVVPVILWGYRHVVLSTDKTIIYSVICSMLGLLTFCIHSMFFIVGFEQFNLPLSLLVLLICLFSSIYQLVQTWKLAKSK
jgi:hypothetical protein